MDSSRESALSIANPGPTVQSRRWLARAACWLDRTGQRFVTDHREGTIVAWTLGSFVVLWMVFDSVALAPVDVHYDVDEALVWAQTFAFGYKHPPMTAWFYGLWFAVFPRADWAAHLQDVTVIAVTLAVTWWLLRDHLDRNCALFGLAALMLVPLYTVKTAELDVNTMMMPFWPAAIAFYLRARRGLGTFDAFLAGAFASMAVLSKYWSVYLMAGMAAASFVGGGTGRFWRSAAPYVMALGAAIVIAPHVYWFVTQRGGDFSVFFQLTVMASKSFGEALGRSGRYLLGLAGYAAGPLILLAALRPSRAALADIACPADADRQQALILFLVPLLLPALVNIALPHRLTPDWTFPNWALLPVVLYSSRLIAIDARDVARAGLLALAATLAVVIASPFFAYARLHAGDDPFRMHSRQVAELAESLTGNSVRLFWGSRSITGGLPFYLPNARQLATDPMSDAGRAQIEAQGLVVICIDDDLSCQGESAQLSGAADHTTTVSLKRTFLGFSGPSTIFHITVLPSGTAN